MGANRNRIIFPIVILVSLYIRPFFAYADSGNIDAIMRSRELKQETEANQFKLRKTDQQAEKVKREHLQNS